MLIMAFVRVAPSENGDIIELPTEEDKTMLLSTLVASFPGACNLKYKLPSGATRGIRNVGGRLHPPSTDGWGNMIYYCVFPSDSFTQSSSQSLLERIRTKKDPMNSTACSDRLPFSERLRVNADSAVSSDSELLLERLRGKKDLNNSTASSDVFCSLLRKVNDSKASWSSSASQDSNDLKKKKISETILELKKAYKEKLMYDFILKSFKDLVFEKPCVLPALKFCMTNILKERVGFFLYSSESWDPKLYEAIFCEPPGGTMEQLNIKDSKDLQDKLFPLVARRAQDAIDSINEVNNCGFASFLTEGSVKPGSILTDEQMSIISQCRKVKNTHDKCKETANQIKEILMRLSDLRTETLPRSNIEAVDCLKAQAAIIDKETRSFNAEIEEKIKEGDENFLGAVKILHSNLKEAVDQKTYRLAKLRKQREDYDAVKGPKFFEMVNEYNRLLSLYNSKKELLPNCQESPSFKSWIESSDED